VEETVGEATVNSKSRKTAVVRYTVVPLINPIICGFSGWRVKA